MAVRQEKWVGPGCKDPQVLRQTYSFDKYLLSPCYVPGKRSWAPAVDKTKFLHSWRVHSSGEVRQTPNQVNISGSGNCYRDKVGEGCPKGECQGWSRKADNKATFEQQLKGVREPPTWRWVGGPSRQREQHLPSP